MEINADVNLRKLRSSGLPAIGKTVVQQTMDGYIVQLDGEVLCAVNSKRPRVFKNFETLVKSLRKMGITEFEVNALKAA